MHPNFAGTDLQNNKVHFSTEKDDVSLYGTPKEELGPINTSRYPECRILTNWLI